MTSPLDGSGEVRERLARIETKVDLILEHGRDHETRLRWLEKENWLHRGGLGIVSFIAWKLGLPWMHVG